MLEASLVKKSKKTQQLQPVKKEALHSFLEEEGQVGSEYRTYNKIVLAVDGARALRPNPLQVIVMSLDGAALCIVVD
jgi:RNA:NAD 2'-phosphotransferase (TPT1/KptA family)